MTNLEPTITLTDMGSEYGTYINDGILTEVKCHPRDPVALASGCQVRFGKTTPILRLVFEDVNKILKY